MFNPFTLENKTILITGASSGIGRQCAIDCSKMGAKVVLVARNEERLNETLSLMAGEGHLLFPYDLNDLNGIKELVSSIVARKGRLNGFIHSAGVELTKPLQLLSFEDYSAIIRVNSLSAFEFVHHLSNIKNMNKGGSIVLIASISGVIGRSSISAYSASKGAIISACRSMAIEFSIKHIRVNCVSPGTILTPLMQKYLNSLDDLAREKRVDGFPLGLGDPEDISNACIFLLSDASRWITGQNLIVDGGYTVK
jgi:NAD(P)-dependent dehydrogenase (short-subunit alcohol dehydrogenase family)